MNTELTSATDPSWRAIRRFKYLVIGVLVAYVCLIKTHQGEFWPFSRFPMFARAGRPWERSLVREVSAQDLQKPLLEVWEKELPGSAFPLRRFKISQDDLAQVMKRLGASLTPEDAAFVALYFEEPRQTRSLVLYRARGQLRADHSVRIRFQPLLLIDAAGVRGIPAPALGTPAAPAVEAPAPQVKP